MSGVIVVYKALEDELVDSGEKLVLEDTQDEDEEPVVESKEAYDQRTLRRRAEDIEEARKIASTGQNKQADKMLKKNRKAINELKVGN